MLHFTFQMRYSARREMLTRNPRIKGKHSRFKCPSESPNGIQGCDQDLVLGGPQGNRLRAHYKDRDEYGPGTGIIHMPEPSELSVNPSSYLMTANPIVQVNNEGTTKK